MRSISGDAKNRQDVVKMAHFLKGELEAVGVSVEFRDLGKHVMDGQELQLPPAILGSIGSDPKKKTVLLYAHYDVQPVRLLWLDLGASFDTILRTGSQI